MNYVYGELSDKIPPIDIFLKNTYKQHDIPDIPNDKVREIVEMNSFGLSQKVGSDAGDMDIKFSRQLKGFISLINHSRTPNVIQQMVTPEVTFVLASQDISEGEEIFIDYAEGMKDLEKRNEVLARWGIKEQDDGSTSQCEIVGVNQS